MNIKIFHLILLYKDISPNTVWNKTHILKSISGETLFVINHPITLNRINEAHQIFLHQPPIFKYTLADWNNETIMNQLYELHLKRTIRRSVQWNQVFQNWIQQKSNIIELYTHLGKVYDLNYEISERELRSWRTMFRTLGCTNITPYNNDISYDEFWTNATNSEKDRETITNLYMEGFLKISLRDSSNKLVDTSCAFWNCFRNSYDANPKGINGKIRTLSIIGEDFTYKEIIEKLEVIRSFIFFT